jgi:hypothetical protein
MFWIAKGGVTLLLEQPASSAATSAAMIDVLRIGLLPSPRFAVAYQCLCRVNYDGSSKAPGMQALVYPLSRIAVSV